MESSSDNEYNLATTIKANKKYFNSVFAVGTYIKTFMFGGKRLQVQIEAMKNCKSKIALKTTIFATLTIWFLEDDS